MIKPHYSENRSVLADVVPLKTPYSVQCEPSQLCNLKCNYCMQSFIHRDKKRMMDMATFMILCDRIREMGRLKQFNFAGWGEPLVNPDLPEMIRYLKICNITDNIAIITNGILLKPPLIKKLIEAGTDHIRISMQGMTSDKYLTISGKSVDIKKYINNVKYLYEHRKNCKVSVKIADISLGTGMEKQMFFNTFVPITNSVYIESIRPMFKENQQDGKVISKYGFEHPPVQVCPQPFFMMAVTATGDIFPCCNYYDPANLGNIWYKPLTEAWADMKQIQLAMLDGRKKQKEFPVCKTCSMPDAVLTPGDEMDEKAGEVRARYG